MYTHQQAESLRYAEMKSSMNNKSFLQTSAQSNGIKTNLKSKFQYFQQSLAQIQTQVRLLVDDTHKSLRKCQQLKNSLGGQVIEEYRVLCKDQIKMFEKEYLLGKAQTESKTKELWNGCKTMNYNSQHLKNQIKEVQNRIQKIQVTLGFYNAEQKMNTY